MKKELLKEIIETKNSKKEFAIITNINTGENCIYKKNKQLNKSFDTYKEKIDFYLNKKKNGTIEESNIFIETFSEPKTVIIVGAVHIAQYLVNFIKDLNFEIFIIDPRSYFASKERFPNINVINKWPKESFSEIKCDKNSALITLTHDPKIDDPAIQLALENKFFYIGALGSKKTHASRCLRLKDANFLGEEINKIHGPIGIKIGGKSAPEIALSIAAQLIAEVNKKQ
jgi:xanthine dehydrogenase accessory factor